MKRFHCWQILIYSNVVSGVVPEFMPGLVSAPIEIQRKRSTHRVEVGPYSYKEERPMIEDRDGAAMT